LRIWAFGLSEKTYDQTWTFIFEPGVNFNNILLVALTLVDPDSIKNTVKSSVSFYAFGIYGRAQKLYVER